MKSIDEAEAQARLDEILDEAQQQPIAIQRQGQDVAVMLSTASYERLRAGAVQAFLGVRNDVASEAAAAGLTEARLLELLRGG
jgi:prevent-host-death family protein